MSKRHQCPGCDAWTNEPGFCPKCSQEFQGVQESLNATLPACDRPNGCISKYACTKGGECVSGHAPAVHNELQQESGQRCLF